MSLPTRPASPGCRPRRRRLAGTACSFGTTRAGGSRWSRWPIRGSRRRRWATSTERVRPGPMVTAFLPRRCSGRACRCGSRGSTASPGRCVGTRVGPPPSHTTSLPLTAQRSGAPRRGGSYLVARGVPLGGGIGGSGAWGDPRRSRGVAVALLGRSPRGRRPSHAGWSVGVAGPAMSVLAARGQRSCWSGGDWSGKATGSAPSWRRNARSS
jgi:hypothetical protein